MIRSRNGFTLIEVVIALAIISLALAAVIEAQGQGIKLTQHARFTSRAVFLARLVIIEAQRQDISLDVSKGEFQEPLSHLAWERRITSFNSIPGLYKIVVNIHPSDRPANEGLAMVGLVYKAPE